MGLKDLVIKGRLRTTLVPLLNAMPVVGAVQVRPCHRPGAQPQRIPPTLAWPVLRTCSNAVTVPGSHACLAEG